MNVVQPIRDPAVVDAIRDYLKLTSLRNYIFFSLGVYSGLRVSDLLSLQVSAVRGQTHISILEAKTAHTRRAKKKRRFIIHPELLPDLRRYIEGMNDEDYLFPSRQRKRHNGMKGEPFDRSTAYKMLQDVAQRFELKDIGTHTMRKTWGYHLYMRDPRNLALLMEMFGHSDTAITLRYLGLTQDAMDDAIRRLSYT